MIKTIAKDTYHRARRIDYLIDRREDVWKHATEEQKEKIIKFIKTQNLGALQSLIERIRIENLNPDICSYQELLVIARWANIKNASRMPAIILRSKLKNAEKNRNNHHTE